MATSKGTNGPGLAMMAIGGVFAYAAIKGFSVLASFQNLVTGKSPATQTQTTQIGTPTSNLGPSVAGNTPGAVTNPSSGQWTHAGLMGLWQSVGGSAASANNAACHAIQESSGNASVTSSNPDGGTNVGLWQLDTKGVGAGHSVAELQNPHINASITVRATGDGRNWSQWATPGC